MVQYGKKIGGLQYKPWAQYYLDYAHLKEILQGASYGGPKPSSNSLAGGGEDECEHQPLLPSTSDSVAQELMSLTSQWTPQETDPVTVEFLSVLHLQLEKITLFLWKEQGHVAQTLASCRDQLWQAGSEEQCQAVHQRYLEAGADLLRLVQFCEVNLTAVRKIIKKHDKQRRIKMSNHFWVSKRSKVHASILARPLLSQNDVFGALVVVLETGLHHLRQQQAQLRERFLTDYPESGVPPPPPPPRHNRGESAPDLAYGLSDDLPSRARSEIFFFSPSTDSNKKSFFQSIRFSSDRYNRQQHVSGSMHTETILIQIMAARRRLNQTNNFVQLLAAPMLVDTETTGMAVESTEVESEEVEAPRSGPSALSNFLNLMSTFLYMTNYYIVAPTSGLYASKLGAEASVASIIIGMTPIAALASTILYSWWSSYSYKSALLFASTCSLVGNLLYAAGLPLNSLTLVMIGRLLNGFGSARSINRRYIVDTFSRQERTAASAAFVTAGALGMAAGPAIASLLNWLVPNSSSNMYWQVENAPGWVMFGVWGIYTVTMFFYFHDPPKKIESAIEPTSEKTPLLSSKCTSNEEKLVDMQPIGILPLEPPIWHNVPVMTTFVIYFVIKFILEGILSSSSTVTTYFFGWNASVCGIFLALTGLLMLPANLGVAYLSRRYDDRELLIGLLVLMMAGCLGVIKYTDQYSTVQYAVASIVVFIGSNALEGPNMSLLSKTIPKSWSKGIFNVGLLSTEAGTFGRAVCDVFLMLIGKHGIDNLLNRAFGTFATMSFGVLMASILLFDHLEASDDSDD